MPKACLNKSGCRIPLEIKQATASRHTEMVWQIACQPILFLSQNFLHSFCEKYAYTLCVTICHHKYSNYFSQIAKKRQKDDKEWQSLVLLAEWHWMAFIRQGSLNDKPTNSLLYAIQHSQSAHVILCHSGRKPECYLLPQKKPIANG